jgi:hypothetical protein
MIWIHLALVALLILAAVGGYIRQERFFRRMRRPVHPTYRNVEQRQRDNQT